MVRPLPLTLTLLTLLLKTHHPLARAASTNDTEHHHHRRLAQKKKNTTTGVLFCERCSGRVPSGSARPEQGLSPAALELGHHAERLPAPGAGGGDEVVDAAEEAGGDPGAPAQRARVRRAGLHNDPHLHAGWLVGTWRRRRRRHLRYYAFSRTIISAGHGPASVSEQGMDVLTYNSFAGSLFFFCLLVT